MNGNCGTKSELKLLQLRNECWFSPLKTCIHWIQILKWKFVPFSPYFEMENCSIESRFLTGKFFHWVLILIWEIVLLSPDSNIENCFIESSYPPKWKSHKAATSNVAIHKYVLHFLSQFQHQALHYTHI